MDIATEFSSLGLGSFTSAYGIGASILGASGTYWGWRGRSESLRLMRQFARERKRSDQLAHFVIPMGLALAAESDYDLLLEKILLEAKSLANADGGTLYLTTLEKTLRFGMVVNDSLKICMGCPASQPVTLAPLHLYDPESGAPNLKNIAAACALGAKVIAVADAYHAPGFDFSGTKAFDQQMGYRTISVLCVPLKDPQEQVIGVLQLINAQDGDTRRVIPFDEHLVHSVGLLGLLAASALKSNIRIQKLTEELQVLRIQIDNTKKEQQVAAIADSSYFKDLQAKAQEMRAKIKGQVN